MTYSRFEAQRDICRALGPDDRLVVAFARSGLRFGELIVSVFGERDHRAGEPCLFEISDVDLAAALERHLDKLEANS